MTERRMVERDSDEVTDDEDTPLIPLIAKLQEILAAIPPEQRESAVLHIRGREYYTHVDVRWKAPESDEELKARTDREAQRAAEREASDRREYERLTAKFRRDSALNPKDVVK